MCLLRKKQTRWCSFDERTSMTLIGHTPMVPVFSLNLLPPFIAPNSGRDFLGFWGSEDPPSKLWRDQIRQQSKNKDYKQTFTKTKILMDST